MSIKNCHFKRYSSGVTKVSCSNFFEFHIFGRKMKNLWPHSCFIQMCWETDKLQNLKTIKFSCFKKIKQRSWDKKFIAKDNKIYCWRQKKMKKKTQKKTFGDRTDFAILSEKRAFCVEIKSIAHLLMAKEMSNKAKIASFSMHKPFLHKRIE